MWFFKVPEFYFGEDALDQLADLDGKRVFIVTDETIQALGLVDKVQRQLTEVETIVFAEVEPDPSLQTVQRGAEAMIAYQPDWIIGLGGGSSMDAAKAMWILYENPGIDPESISPFEPLGLRKKARLICIPTTAGTGSESNYGIVLTDTKRKRKLTLGSREATPDMAIVDPQFTFNLPRQITADTGIDVLSHAIEGYTCNWANDFTDGLCVNAARMVFRYLPRAVADGNDAEAREKMANAASIAGMALGNSQVALAHAIGHSAGAVFKQIPHGRITAIFLPYTIRFIANGGGERYSELASLLGLAVSGDEKEDGHVLATAVLDLLKEIDQPVSLAEAGVDRDEFAEAMSLMVEHIEMDANTLMSQRFPDTEEIEKLLWCAYDGTPVDF